MSARPARRVAPGSRARTRGRPPRRTAYRIVEHAADVGAAVSGATLRHLFENAAAALLDLGGSRDAVLPRRRVRVRARGATLEDLLVRWLSEIRYLEDPGGWRFRSCRVASIDRRRLAASGVAFGERHDAVRHAPLREIKAITYHQIRIARSRGRWRVRLFFDV